MRKLFSFWPGICVMLALLLTIGCATLQDPIVQIDYKTFELTIDKQKIVVTLPNELPSMDRAIYDFEKCFNVKVCRQGFCVSDDPGHDHVDFVFIDTEVIAVVWIRTKEMTDPAKRFIAWIYVEGKPVMSNVEAINNLIAEHDPK